MISESNPTAMTPTISSPGLPYTLRFTSPSGKTLPRHLVLLKATRKLNKIFALQMLKGASFGDCLDLDSPSDDEEIAKPVSEKNVKLKTLVKMGYNVQKASVAMERCGVY